MQCSQVKGNLRETVDLLKRTPELVFPFYAEEEKFIFRNYTTFHYAKGHSVRTRTRINTNPNDIKANVAGRNVRTCVARKSKS